MMINSQYGFYNNKVSYKTSNNNNEYENQKQDVQKKYTYWRFDEKGNIVYYTIDEKTGNILSTETYNNPAAEISRLLNKN